MRAWRSTLARACVGDITTGIATIELQAARGGRGPCRRAALHAAVRAGTPRARALLRCC